MNLSGRHIFRICLVLIAIFGVLGAGLLTRPHTETKKQAEAQLTTPEARDARREADLEAMAEAIRTSTKLHNGVYPFVVPKVETGICSGASANCKQAKLVDLVQLISDGTIVSIPNDPSGGKGAYSTGYALKRNADGRIELLAPRSEGSTTISVKL